MRTFAKVLAIIYIFSFAAGGPFGHLWVINEALGSSIPYTLVTWALGLAPMVLLIRWITEAHKNDNYINSTNT